MGNPNLSTLLIQSGWFCAFGTTEHLAGRAQLVKAGVPWTTDYNGGVTVVFDESGRPWIKRGRQDLILFGKLTVGAYVPHGNDGGDFVRKSLPGLMAGLKVVA